MRAMFFGGAAVSLLAALPVFFAPPRVPFSESSPMSFKEALGQTLIIGFEGKEMTLELEALIRKVQPGGVLLLARNIETKEQTVKLIADLQRISTIPLFVAVDQEGGQVSRAWWGERTLQSNLKDHIEALMVGEERGRDLRESGFTMNFAPLLDSNGPGDYLFPRSFQKDALSSSLLAFNLVWGQEKEGVVSVVKHYPGYDGIGFNPETSVLPRVKEFPKVEAFDNLFFWIQPRFLMLSHVVYEDIDENTPLPLSDTGIAKIKEEVGRDILLMSDDVLSSAMQSEYSLSELASGVLTSGINVVLAVGYPKAELVEEFYDSLWQTAKEDLFSSERIYRVAEEILSLKLALFQDR